MLTLIIWLKWSLPGFSTVIFLFFSLYLFFKIALLFQFFQVTLDLCSVDINKGILMLVTEPELPKCIVAPTTCYSGRLDETICIFLREAQSLFGGGVGKS